MTKFNQIVCAINGVSRLCDLINDSPITPVITNEFNALFEVIDHDIKRNELDQNQMDTIQDLMEELDKKLFKRGIK